MTSGLLLSLFIVEHIFEQCLHSDTSCTELQCLLRVLDKTSHTGVHTMFWPACRGSNFMQFKCILESHKW